MGVRYYKATGPNGLAFYDKETQYIVGRVMTHPNPQMNSELCGRGYHCSPHLFQTRKYVSADLRQCEWFELEVEESDIIARDTDKVRVKWLSVVRALSESDFWIIRGRLDEVLGYGNGDGSGPGSGSGYGYGLSVSGAGYGNGDGPGPGSGYGLRVSGAGYGNGDGSGSGSGSGYGLSVSGAGYGNGNGDGPGSGYGLGLSHGLKEQS